MTTTRELERLGVSRRELGALQSSGALERVVRGVYARPLEHPTREQTYRRMVLGVLAGCAADAERPVLAGPAAVVMHGLPLLGPAPSVVHVAAPQCRGRKTGQLLHAIGTLDPGCVTNVDGLRVARPAEAVLDTARLMTVVSGVAAADAALRGTLTTEAELREACHRRAGSTGVERARRTVRLATPLSESPGESWSAVVMDTLRLPAPERQHPLHDAAGFVGRVDFWWPERGVAGEFDGRVKYGRTNPSGRPPEDVLWDEKLREDRLRALGVRVVRWTTTELGRSDRLAVRLSSLLLPRR